MAYIIEGTWEEIKQHEAEFAGQYLRVIVAPEVKKKQFANDKAMTAQPSHRVSAMGKYAGVLDSEAFMRRKHEDIILEDRPLR